MPITRREIVTVASPAVLAGLTMSSTTSAVKMAGAELRSIVGDITIAEDVVLRPGERFSLAPGSKLTLLGDLDAPPRHIFVGPGTVDLTRSRVLAARPEWWGAVPNDATVDSEPALRASLRAHLTTHLGAGDYFLGRSLVIDRSNRRLWGIGRTKDAGGTRLVLMHDEGPVVIAGTEQPPPEINDYVRGLDVRWIEAGRARPAPPPSGDPDHGTGFALRHVLDGIFEGLRANEHAIGFSALGAVRTFLRDCTAFRSAVGGSGRDIFIGFDCDGRASPISTGANASLYVTDCSAFTGGRPRLAQSIGCRLLGTMSDTYLTRFETTEVGIGVLLDGMAAQLDPARRRAGHVDIHLDGLILDACLDSGIVISELSDSALVDVGHPYIALADTGSSALSINRCGGNVTVTGGQLIGWVATSGQSKGVELASTRGVAITNLKCVGFATSVSADHCAGLDLVLSINASQSTQSRAATVTMKDCRDVYLRPQIGGAGLTGPIIALDHDCSGILIEAIGVRNIPAPVSWNGQSMALDNSRRCSIPLKATTE